jgi:gas vesicle protein
MNEVETMEMRKGRGGGMLLAFLGGAAVGSLLAVLFAPRSGPETRRRIAELAEDSKERAGRVPLAVREAKTAAVTAFSEALKQQPS